MTTWRIGTKVPLNVYDGDRPVCQCHSVEDAVMIVGAVNQRFALESAIAEAANRWKLNNENS